MSFVTLDRCVLAFHEEKDEWALIVCISRKQNGRRLIIPFIFAGEHCELFATSPHFRSWGNAGLIYLLRTRELNPKQRAAILENAIKQQVGEIASCATVLASSVTGLLSSIRNLSYAEATANFEIGTEPAFRWLLQNDTSGKAWDTLRSARAMADRQRLGERTLKEREEVGMKLFTNRGGRFA